MPLPDVCELLLISAKRWNQEELDIKPRGAAQERDPFAIGRPGRAEVEPRVRSETFRLGLTRCLDIDIEVLDRISIPGKYEVASIR